MHNFAQLLKQINAMLDQCQRGHALIQCIVGQVLGCIGIVRLHWPHVVIGPMPSNINRTPLQFPDVLPPSCLFQPPKGARAPLRQRPPPAALPHAREVCRWRAEAIGADSAAPDVKHIVLHFGGAAALSSCQQLLQLPLLAPCPHGRPANRLRVGQVQLDTHWLYFGARF